MKRDTSLQEKQKAATDPDEHGQVESLEHLEHLLKSSPELARPMLMGALEQLSRSVLRGLRCLMKPKRRRSLPLKARAQAENEIPERGRCS